MAATEDIEALVKAFYEDYFDDRGGVGRVRSHSEQMARDYDKWIADKSLKPKFLEPDDNQLLRLVRSGLLTLAAKVDQLAPRDFVNRKFAAQTREIQRLQAEVQALRDELL